MAVCCKDITDHIIQMHATSRIGKKKSDRSVYKYEKRMHSHTPFVCHLIFLLHMYKVSEKGFSRGICCESWLVVRTILQTLSELPKHSHEYSMLISSTWTYCYKTLTFCMRTQRFEYSDFVCWQLVETLCFGIRTMTDASRAAAHLIFRLNCLFVIKAMNNL